MFNFIRNYFYNRSRLIFHFRDGKTVRGADPIAVWRAILADPDFDVEKDSTLIELNDEAAWRRCINAVRNAFSIPDFSAGGLSENELFELFQAFCLYVNAVKKNFSHWPISSGVTGSTLRSGLGTYWEPATPQPSASTSIPPEPNFDAPPRLQTG